MWADVLTKKMKLARCLEAVLVSNVAHLLNVSINKVVSVSGKIWMNRINNQNVKKEEKNKPRDEWIFFILHPD